MAGMWWARPFLSAVDIFKVDVQSAYSVKAMVEAVRDQGRKLMIFPEGRLTNTGALMKVSYEGAAVVADKARAKILPISIDGLQFTRLGRMKGKLPMWWFPHLAVTIMPPVDLSTKVPPGLDRHKHREALGNALQDLLVDTVFRAKQTDRTLFGALLDARAKYGGRVLIAEDLAREPISYNRLVLGAAILGRKLATVTKPGERVGVLLPNANGTVATFMALQAFGRVPAMLNFSAGGDAMLSACKAAEAATIISSRVFIEKAKLQKLIERLEQQVRHPVDRRPARLGCVQGQAERHMGFLVRAQPARCKRAFRCHRRGSAVHLRLRGQAQGRCAQPPQASSPIVRSFPASSISVARTACSTRCRCFIPSD